MEKMKFQSELSSEFCKVCVERFEQVKVDQDNILGHLENLLKKEEENSDKKPE